jgi:hypothetical protein
MPRKHDAHKDELEGVAQRLRSERPEASPLEMDQIKTSAMSRAQAGARRGGANARRFAVAGLTVGLMAAGTGGVLASVGSGGASSNAATAQYGSGCDLNNGNGNSTGSGNGNKDGNGNGNTSFAAYYGKYGGKSKGGGNGDNNGNGSNNNSSGNGIENGSGNGNENGNESNDGNNNFNCNENSFNETNITETNNSTTTNITNNYYNAAVTVTAAAPAGSGGVQASTTTKKASVKHPVKFRIDISKKSKLRKVTLKINGKIVSVLKGKKAKATISIANLPCSPSGTTVTVTAVTALGKTVTESHTYYLCS